MVLEQTNESWRQVLSLYDDLDGPSWKHIKSFRELVAKLGSSPQASGLTAVKSHETLLISPYSQYPDWFEGRNLRVIPRPDGQVEVIRSHGRFDSRPSENWILGIDDACETILRLMEGL
jgi:hypothetical protein